MKCHEMPGLGALPSVERQHDVGNLHRSLLRKPGAETQHTQLGLESTEIGGPAADTYGRRVTVLLAYAWN